MSRMADAEIELSRAEHGGECPLCRAGTIETVDGENRCRGECGAVTESQNLHGLIRRAGRVSNG